MLPGFGPTQRRLLDVLVDEQPRSLRALREETGLTSKAVGSALYRLWKGGAILRTAEPTYESFRAFKGRAGIKKNTRAYYLYLYKPLKQPITLQGLRFVCYDEKYLDKRGSGQSKAQLIRDFLRENIDRAYYSTEVKEALQDEGVKQRDVMSTVRRAEKKGLVYVRGYRTHDRQTPFEKGYMLTWLDNGKPREETLDEAIERTEKALRDTESITPVIERVHRIRDIVMESSKLRDLASFNYIKNELGCTEYKCEKALERGMQLYPDIKVTKIFDNFRYYYHTSISDEDLCAMQEMKENYIRITKGRANRIGHNWEAVVGYFIDNLTQGADFRTQNHRNGKMDPRRITIHLMKPVGGRRRNAEVDRVWKVTPAPMLDPITYVLECKWGLVRRRHIDDFFDVLRWSKEFGVDTPDGRQKKQSVIGAFAGSAFNKNEKVRLKDGSHIPLTTYAARMNIQLFNAADFNKKLRNRGSQRKTTVQKICKLSGNEAQVREVLEKIWKTPEKGNEILKETANQNQEIFEFEKMLEQDT